MMLPADLPEALSALCTHDWTAVTLGESKADVWRIGTSGGALYLKASPRLALDEYHAELARLDWLAEMGFPAPRIVDTTSSADRDWLLMTAVTGADLTTLAGQPDVLCHVYAQGLRRLHALDPSRCPFDHSLPGRLADARANLDAGLVDEDDFDDERRGWRASQVYDWLSANMPPSGNLVVTHGDACVPNFMAENGRFSGIVDCSRLGLADKWQDLALACRSLERNCGREHIPAFLAAYGAEWDEIRYRFYSALDELF